MSTRIAVAGKGGSGKTTVAATLARLLARRGLSVTAIDDDPNPNLAVALGVPTDQRAALHRVPRDVLVPPRPFGDVVAEYGVRAPDGVATVIMTGVEEAGSG